MTGVQSVTANFQCSGPAPLSFLTGYLLNGPPLRRDFTGWVGMKLTTGAGSLLVSSLGRMCVAGNLQSHLVKLVNAGDGSDVAGGSVSINTASRRPQTMGWNSLLRKQTAPGRNPPKALFQTRLKFDQGYDSSTLARQYDVTSDGQRFLLNQHVADSTDAPITVVVNWPKLLAK
jgi:hypothetical protein